MTPASNEPAGAGYEHRDAKLRPLVVGTLATFALMTFAMFAMRFLLGALDRSTDAARPAAHALAEERQMPPAPRLQLDPPRDLDEHRRRMTRHATSYGWLDEEAGVVHIPVERAMELVAQRGLPFADEREAGR